MNETTYSGRKATVFALQLIEYYIYFVFIMEESDCLRTPGGKIVQALYYYTEESDCSRTPWNKYSEESDCSRTPQSNLKYEYEQEESDCSRTPWNKYRRKATVLALHNPI